MIKKSLDNIPVNEVTAFNSKKTTIQWFRQPNESAYFMLRRFEIGANGNIGIHQHPEEHQMYILKGPILLLDENGKETEVFDNEFVYMEPNALHGYRNPNDYAVSFICGIPKLEKNS